MDDFVEFWDISIDQEFWGVCAQCSAVISTSFCQQVKFDKIQTQTP
jgi:hypothetical protein